MMYDENARGCVSDDGGGEDERGDGGVVDEVKDWRLEIF